MRTKAPAELSSTPFSVDEGFVEPHDGDDEVSSAFEQHSENFQRWVSGLREEQKRDITLALLKSLRTSMIASIVDDVQSLLHHNFLTLLPDELVGHILGFLDAKDLLTAALASHSWRSRISDPRLWKDLFKQEGWAFDYTKLTEFEQHFTPLLKIEFDQVRRELRGSTGKGEPASKRRALSDRQSSNHSLVQADFSQWQEQHGIIEAGIDVDHEMMDLGSPIKSPTRRNKRQSHDSGDEMDLDDKTPPAYSEPLNSPALARKLLIENESREIKPNWAYIYKQRYRLEDNWMQGRYVNFQLPHPSYPHEAHTECVYTIQFHGKWLVSGSRDRTLRVWDLETRRLRGNALKGHAQSVLCLQFDPTEGEDVIISGSSDASVIVWKFSTGQIVNVIRSAHEESVLNLRFDHRYLVTCSKDKKIKIWNRHSLTPLDDDYPHLTERSNSRTPSYIINLSMVEPSMIEARLANGQIKPLAPYTHLMTLEGHAAAVNAIQIHGDIIVSASGDRLIRVWNAKTGVCLRVISGHLKGIACVQFDSKRIVSGSSDNTVRIYDPITAAEVAVLMGHTNLVRTVQAGFGDAPGDEEDGLAEARRIDDEYLQQLQANNTTSMRDDRHLLRRIKHGEFGSSRTAVGSKLPPGGGGSKWGRIVSGSYDESIIIWKKDEKGNWVVGQTLRQDAALRATIDHELLARRLSNIAPAAQGRQQIRQRSNTSTLTPTNPSAPAAAGSRLQQATNAMSGLQQSISSLVSVSSRLNLPPSGSAGTGNQGGSTGVLLPAVQSAISHIASPFTTTTSTVSNVVSHQQGVSSSSLSPPGRENGNLSVDSSSSNRHHPPSGAGTGTSSVTTGTTTTHSMRAGDSSTSHQATAGSPSASAAPTMSSTDQADYLQQRALLAQQPNPPTLSPRTPAGQPTAVSTAPPGVVINSSRQVPAPNPHPMNQNWNPHVGSVSRVFKLQFDARRIVCCSQDFRIIGWDFANGDKDIESVCPFFVAP